MAVRLFSEQGYEQTTVDQIGAALGMSGRNVFRYFATKEDIVVGAMAQAGEDIADRLAARPADEAPWDALRAAMDEPLRSLADDGGIALARTRLLATTPALRTAQRDKHAQWKGLLAPILAGRFEGGEKERNLQAEAVVLAFLACMDIAVSEWASRSDATELGPLLDAAIRAVRR